MSFVFLDNSPMERRRNCEVEEAGERDEAASRRTKAPNIAGA